MTQLKYLLPQSKGEYKSSGYPKKKLNEEDE